MIRRAALCLIVGALGISATGCRSPRIDVTVENRTGVAIEILEVDYPSASFGVDRLAAGANYRYGIQTRGSGNVQIQYTDPVEHRQAKATGPHLEEHQSGSLTIVLLPGGKAQFQPSLSASR